MNDSRKLGGKVPNDLAVSVVLPVYNEEQVLPSLVLSVSEAAGDRVRQRRLPGS